jgi:CheY-like chemotaxis protein
MEHEMNPLCLVLSDDLLDASRVVGEGRAAGLSVIQCRDSSAILAAIDRGPVLALLDLHNPGLRIEELAPALKSASLKVICYGSHVDASRLKAARLAGCDEVLPRSAFFTDLENGLRRWTRPSVTT